MNVNAPRTMPGTPKDQQPQQASMAPEIAAMFEAPARPSLHDFVIAGSSGLFLEVVYLDFLDLLTAYAAVICLCR